MTDHFWYKQHGICTHCHTERTFYGHTLCPACIEKQAAYDAGRDLSKPRRAMRERYARLKGAGICVNCGAKPAKPGRVQCAACAVKHRIIANRRNAARRVTRPDGVCWRRGCENPVLPGKRTCADHYTQMCEWMRRAREKTDTENHIWRRQDHADVEKLRGKRAGSAVGT